MLNLSQADTATELGWPQSQVSLVATARVRLEMPDAVSLLDLYRVRGAHGLPGHVLRSGSIPV